MAPSFCRMDLLAIVPFWARVFFTPDSILDPNQIGVAYESTFIRVVESLDSLRCLKLCRYYSGSGLLMKAVSMSTEQLLVTLDQPLSRSIYHR